MLFKIKLTKPIRQNSYTRTEHVNITEQHDEVFIPYLCFMLLWGLEAARSVAAL